MDSTLNASNMFVSIFFNPKYAILNIIQHWIVVFSDSMKPKEEKVTYIFSYLS